MDKLSFRPGDSRDFKIMDGSWSPNSSFCNDARCLLQSLESAQVVTSSAKQPFEKLCRGNRLAKAALKRAGFNANAESC